MVQQEVERGQEEEYILKKGDSRVELDEVAKTTTIGDPHLGFNVWPPLGKVEEIGFRGDIAGQVSEARQEGEEDDDQEEEPRCQPGEVADDEHHAQGDLQHDHKNGKPIAKLHQVGEEGSQTAEGVVQSAHGRFKLHKIVLHFVGGTDGVDSLDQTGEHEPYTGEMLEEAHQDVGGSARPEGQEGQYGADKGKGEEQVGKGGHHAEGLSSCKRIRANTA